MRDDAEQMQSVRLLRIRLQHLPAQALGAIEPAGLAVLLHESEHLCQRHRRRPGGRTAA
jgi:hypothetical protein